jgi:hypothetical protein
MTKGKRIRTALKCGAMIVKCGATLLLLSVPFSHAEETRGYAISLVHTATQTHPENCPNGGNGGTVDITSRALSYMGFRDEQINYILANGGRDESGKRVDTKLRGRIDDQAVDVHVFPMAVPDPQIELVQGPHARGFNLDGKIGGHAFTDPVTGQTGVDNQLWRVLGCFESYDTVHPVIPYNEAIAWDTAMDSMPAWLMAITGDDLGNDGDVTVTFSRSLNIAMRDATTRLLHGSSYTVDPDPRSKSVFKGRIEDGVLTIEPGDFYMQGDSQFYAVLQFTNTQLRFQLHEDGSLSGLIGGYQPWMDYFHYLSIRGEGGAGQIDIPGVYYAMKKLADADPDPVTGQNQRISSAYYMEASPAFHTTVNNDVVAWSWEGASKRKLPVVGQAVTRTEEY